MMNRNELTASALNDTALLDAYYSLAEGGDAVGLGLIFPARNSRRERTASGRMSEDALDAYFAASEGGCIPGMGLTALLAY